MLKSITNVGLPFHSGCRELNEFWSEGKIFNQSEWKFGFAGLEADSEGYYSTMACISVKILIMH